MLYIHLSESLFYVHNFYATNYGIIKTPGKCVTWENIKAHYDFRRLIIWGLGNRIFKFFPTRKFHNYMNYLEPVCELQIFHPCFIICS